MLPPQLRLFLAERRTTPGRQDDMTDRVSFSEWHHSWEWPLVPGAWFRRREEHDGREEVWRRQEDGARREVRLHQQAAPRQAGQAQRPIPRPPFPITR